MRNITRYTPLFFLLSFVLILGTGCSSLKVSYTSDVGDPSTIPYEPTVNVDVKKSNIDSEFEDAKTRESIRNTIKTDIKNNLFIGGQNVVYVDVTIENLSYQAKPWGSLWAPFLYLGAPFFKLKGISHLNVTIKSKDGTKIEKYNSEIKEEAWNGFYYNWDKGVSRKGGIAKDALKKSLESIKKDIMNDASYINSQIEQTLEEELEQKTIAQREKSRDTTPEQAFSPSPVDTQVPKTSIERPNDIAVVLGVKEYENPDVPNVDYAVRDARTMKKYLTRTLGFREENIIYVENASGTDFPRIFGTDDNPEGQLSDWVKPGESSVFVYYSGHGAPNPESGSPYFIPSNTNPNYLSQNGYPVNQLYENLAQLPAESVTVVLEACFSGVSESGAVVSDISPAVLSVENPVMSLEKGLAFTAGAADQVSTWYNEKKHGLFTYYFLNGLRGKADANDDQAVTAKEMEAYLTERVPYRAQRMHSRKQTPQVVGQNLDRVLVQYDGATSAQPEARLPVTTTDVQQSVREALSLPDGAQKVTDASGAENLQRGDVIISVNGSELGPDRSLAQIVGRHVPGDTLKLGILRGGQNQTVAVTLTAK